MSEQPAWEAAAEAMAAEVRGDLDRAEAATLEQLSRIRQQQAAEQH